LSPKFTLGRTERLTVRITPESAARLAQAAEARRVSQTDVLEQLLMSLPGGGTALPEPTVAKVILQQGVSVQMGPQIQTQLYPSIDVVLSDGTTEHLAVRHPSALAIPESDLIGLTLAEAKMKVDRLDN
jgi:Ribbon-helix-helix protein, copG family